MTVPMREYKPPVNVSPLIRFGRWSALLLGVTYGVSRTSYLQRKEDGMREPKEKERQMRRKIREQEKKAALEKEMAELAKLAGVPKI